jgi:formate hydrogenlyase subunit 3/multisubunit Na+/H+ antiporter MnhD subunit
MGLFLAGLAVLLSGGLAALLWAGAPRVANLLGAASALAGCAIALVPVVATVISGVGPAPLAQPWDVPYGSLSLTIDPLSAWFALPILGLSALAAIYAAEYLLQYADRKNLGAAWLFYNLLVAAMVVVVTAGNGVLFLVAWEVMALASYFLVVFDDEQAEVRDAGRIYLIASHLGTAFLLVLFVLLGRQAGTLDFAGINHWVSVTGGFEPQTAGLLFVLAVVGFGTKAGFMPFHVWLPQAHPVAPSHVSAVMSGVMIKTGIYGLLRMLAFLGEPDAWWGWLLIGIGVVSGIMGALYAIAQHDLKRLLAYSSVENVGIISLGLGIGLLGVSLHEPAAAALGFGGALLHVVNHALFKGLLFLGAGAVLHGTHTADINQLGGLLKRMPVVGVTFLVGCVAVCGLPPLNGFVSEFLVYLGAFEEETLSGGAGGVAALLVIGSLALIGGLAMVAFTKAFGVIFLGEPRSDAARHARASGLLMQLPLAILAAACILIPLAAVPIVKMLAPVLGAVVGKPGPVVSEQIAAAVASLGVFVGAAVAVFVIAIGLALLRIWLLSGRDVGASPTWDCGYARPASRMQYSASSFAQPLTDFFGLLLQTRKSVVPPRGFFPLDASLETQTPDVALERGYQPLFRGVNWLLSSLSWMQQGRVSMYVLYIAVTMVVLLVWYVF